MNSASITLLSVWLFLLIAIIVMTIIDLITPKIFQLGDNLNRTEKKQVKRTIAAGPLAEYKHNGLFKASVYGGILSILIYLFALFSMILDHFVLAMVLIALAAALYPFIGVVLPSFQYKYWSKRESSDFTLLAQDRFSKLIILRVIITLCVIGLFLITAVFYDQFLSILVVILSKIMGY